jgi:PAS domain S-box-containing protein/diguanylate cyclase (GGDEF)-like protein
MDRCLRVLALEDVATEAELAGRELKRAGFLCTLVRVETEEEFRGGLEDRPDVILSDFSLPEFDGMAALRIVRSEAPDIPFIFVSGTIGEERAIEALKFGATDYVLKTNLARLGPVVARALQEFQDRRTAQLADQRFRDLVQTSLDWIWEIDVDGQYVFCSPGVEEILGLRAEDLLGRPHLEQVHDEDRALVASAQRSLDAQERRLSNLVARWRHRDGSYRWLERNALALIDSRGLITGFRGTDRDITLRKQQEERIARLSRIHVMLSSINSAILRIRDRQKLLQEVCRIGTVGGYPHTAIFLIEPGTTTVRPVAAEGEHASEVAPFNIEVRADAKHFSGLTEQAICTGLPAACNDLSGSRETVHFRDEALRWGTRACAALPLIVDGTAIGTLVLHAREVGVFTPDELGVLTQVAGSLSFALQYLEKEGTAEFLAYFDPMTGLARRALFIERLTRTLASLHSASAAAVFVFVLDVERLGALNDRYGRHAGDRLLQLVAERLKGVVPNPTDLAHFGNGCFGVMATGSEPTESAADAVRARIIRLFEDDFVVDGQEIRVAIRAGTARFPVDCSTEDALLHNAEVAVKRAKETGENHLYYAAAMKVDLRHRLTLEDQLRRALEDRQFELYYQPKVSLETGSIMGAEALLRWNDPESGLRSPAEFIPVLEASGLIVDVGQWVILQAVRDTIAWHAASLPNVPIAANVSTRQLKRPDFVDSVLAATAPLRAIGRSLDIEITENALMEDLGASAEKLNRLRAAGIGIAIDDFGTGHSSLGRLSRLAVDAIKIDRSFVSSLDTAPDKRAIVSTIIALAQSFGLIAVAEGVETVRELQVLRRLRCHQLQGYLAAKPMPAHAFRELLAGSGGAIKTVYRALNGDAS